MYYKICLPQLISLTPPPLKTLLVVVVLYSCFTFLSNHICQGKKICEHFISITAIFIIASQGGEEDKILMGKKAEEYCLCFICQISGWLRDFI